MKKSMLKPKRLVPACCNFLITLQYPMKDIELYQFFKNHQIFEFFNLIQVQT